MVSKVEFHRAPAHPSSHESGHCALCFPLCPTMSTRSSHKKSLQFLEPPSAFPSQDLCSWCSLALPLAGRISSFRVFLKSVPSTSTTVILYRRALPIALNTICDHLWICWGEKLSEKKAFLCSLELRGEDWILRYAVQASFLLIPNGSLSKLLRYSSQVTRDQQNHSPCQFWSEWIPLKNRLCSTVKQTFWKSEAWVGLAIQTVDQIWIYSVIQNRPLFIDLLRWRASMNSNKKKKIKCWKRGKCSSLKGTTLVWKQRIVRNLR